MIEIHADQRGIIVANQARRRRCLLLQPLVETVLIRCLFQSQRQLHHGHIQGRHPDGVAVNAPGKGWQHLLHRTDGATGGRHNILCPGPAPARIPVDMVQQGLVRGVGMDFFHQHLLDAVLLIQPLQQRCDTVRGAGRR